MTDQKLDQLVAEVWANAIDLSTHGAVSRNDVYRLLDALAALRGERDRMRKVLTDIANGEVVYDGTDYGAGYKDCAENRAEDARQALGDTHD
jgi:hypothetical protein